MFFAVRRKASALEVSSLHPFFDRHHVSPRVMCATQSHPAKRCGQIIYKIEKSRLPSTPRLAAIKGGPAWTRRPEAICVTKDVDFGLRRKTHCFMQTGGLIIQTPAAITQSGTDIACLVGRYPNEVKSDQPRWSAKAGRNEITQLRPNVSDDNHSRPEHSHVPSPSGLLILSNRRQLPNAATLKLEPAHHFFGKMRPLRRVGPQELVQGMLGQLLKVMHILMQRLTALQNAAHRLLVSFVPAGM